MTDLEEMRRRYGGLPLIVKPGDVIDTPPPKDPAVLALCDEVESLRAQVQDLEAQLADRNARLYDLAHPDDTGHPSPDDAPHTDDPFWLPDDL